MSLKTIQKLLVISALLWAMLPTWGGLLYAAAWTLLAVGTSSRIRAARVVLEAHREELARGLSGETLSWVGQHPFFYVWRETAKEWGTTWRMTGILAIFLAPWFFIRALFLRETWEFVLLAPLAVLLIVGVRIALKVELVELLKEKKKLEPFIGKHEEALRYLTLRAAAGKWPPVPSPDGGPKETLPPPTLSPPVMPPRPPALGPPSSVRPSNGDVPPKDDKPAE